VFLGDRISRVYMSSVYDFVFEENDFFDGERDSEERRETLLKLVSPLPASLVPILGPFTIAFVGSHDGLLEHLINQIVVFDSNGCAPFDEGKHNLERGDFSSIHSIHKFNSRRLHNDLFEIWVD
jgi:hypothetical protein